MGSSLPRLPRNGLGLKAASQRRVFPARRHGTCANCSEGIQPGQNITTAWGGICHTTCLYKPISTATQSIYREMDGDTPIIAQAEGVCRHCIAKYYPGSIIYRRDNHFIHRHCANQD